MESIAVFFARIAIYLRIAAIGGAGALAQAGTLHYMTGILGRWYMEGVVFGFIAATIIAFMIEKIWVYRDRSKNRTRKKLLLFVLFTVAGLGETMVLMYIFVSIFHFWYIGAQLVTTAIVMATIYPLNVHITFRKQRKLSSAHRRHP